MKVDLEGVASSRTLRFICSMNISIATRDNTNIYDPRANVYFKAEAECLEYETVTPLSHAQPKMRSFIINLERKSLIWEYTLGQYDAINHDEMFEMAVKVIKKLNK